MLLGTVSEDCFTDLHDENAEVMVPSDNNSVMLPLPPSVFAFSGGRGNGGKGP